VAAAGFAFLLVPPAAKQRRRSARRRVPGPAAVVGAWCEALDRLSEAGLACRQPETPREFAERAGRARPGTARPLRRLADLVNGAAYGPAPVAGPRPTGVGPGPPDDAWAAADSVVRALDAHDPPLVRLRRRFDPRPLLPRRG
jgi:hypothetical protein